MAGTLTISTLSDGTNSTSSTNCIQGSAKAWVNFGIASGTTITTYSSFNVSSVTYTATGSFVVNFATALADANYAVSGSAGSNGVNAAGIADTYNSGSARTNRSASAFSMQCGNLGSSFAATNPTSVSVAVFR